MELLAFEEGARREMPLTTVPLSEATTLAWARASHRDGPVQCCKPRLGLTALRWTPTEAVKLTKTTAEESREKTIIPPEEQRPASGTTCSPLALDQSLALLRICSTAASQRRADPRS